MIFLQGICLLVIAFLPVLTHTMVSCDQKSWATQSEVAGYSIVLSPSKGHIPLGRIHNWIIEVRDKDDIPVYPISFLIDGGMPAHGHGLPSNPTGSRYLGDGKYLIEGLAFSMYGGWDLAFLLRSEAIRDRAAIRVEFYPC